MTEIVLNGTKHTLKPTLRAARTVNSMADGFLGAMRGVQNFNLSTMAVVLAAGLGKSTAEEFNQVEEMLYENGVSDLASPLIRFVTLLMNGGREPSPEQSSKQEGSEKN